jgi:hypothetical protein
MKLYNSYLGREFDTEKLEKQFGTVEFDNKKLYLTQQPYIDLNNVYHATAIDMEDNIYEVEWDIRDDFDPRTDEDESNACDWNKYAVRKL